VSGPPPKRSEERIRHNHPAGGPQRRVEITESAPVDPEALAELPLEMKIRQPVVVPAAVGDWDPIVKDLWDSAQRSGAAIYYEPADWHLLRVVCESLDRDLGDKPIKVGSGEDATLEWHPQPLAGASIVAYTKVLSMLGFTEEARRRMGIEVARSRPDLTGEKAASTGDNVTPIDRRASRLG
jgi:hypothetical protein